MAGQAGRRGTDRTGRTDGRSPSARATRFPEIEQIGSDVPTEERTQVSVEAPLAPDVIYRCARTQASYRLLTATGLDRGRGSRRDRLRRWPQGLRTTVDPQAGQQGALPTGAVLKRRLGREIGRAHV